jgi:hypothetical protein
MELWRKLTLRMWCEIQVQAALRRPQRAFEFNSQKLDFIPSTPGKECGLIAKVTVPVQRCAQVSALRLDRRRYVLCGPRLFRDDSPPKARQDLTQLESGDSREGMIELRQKDSGENEKRSQEKRTEEKLPTRHAEQPPVAGRE